MDTAYMVNGTLLAVFYGVNGLVLVQWLILGEGTEYVMPVLRISDPNLKLIENWDTLGMRGTGSNGVHVDGAYIPEHLILRGKDIFGLGKPAGGKYDPARPCLPYAIYADVFGGIPCYVIRGYGSFN